MSPKCQTSKQTLLKISQNGWKMLEVTPNFQAPRRTTGPSPAEPSHRSVAGAGPCDSLRPRGSAGVSLLGQPGAGGVDRGGNLGYLSIIHIYI